jgi:dihydrodipicolinate synthase/N-acetylneuraminate lyase
MPKNSNIPWTPEEDQRLLDLVAAEANWPLIAANLRRSIQAVQERAQKLKRNGVGSS